MVEVIYAVNTKLEQESKYYLRSRETKFISKGTSERLIIKDVPAFQHDLELFTYGLMADVCPDSFEAMFDEQHQFPYSISKAVKSDFKSKEFNQLFKNSDEVWFWELLKGFDALEVFEGVGDFHDMLYKILRRVPDGDTVNISLDNGFTITLEGTTDGETYLGELSIVETNLQDYEANVETNNYEKWGFKRC